MPRWLLTPLVCVLVVVSVGDSRAQTPAAPADGIARLLNDIEKVLLAGDAAAFTPLFSPSAVLEPLHLFAQDLSSPGMTRAVVRERDRLPLDGTLPGDGYRLVVDLFTESAKRGRIVTARVDVRRAHRATDEEWRIAAAERLTSVEGLHRLSVNTETQFTARNLTITAEDLDFVLHQGNVFLVESADGVTGLVLLGRGEMRFSPGPEAERGQVRIFAGAETLTAQFDAAFVRVMPAEYESRVSTASLTKVAVQPRQLRRAQAVFAEEAPKSFSLDLSDLSRETWYLLPGFGDVLAEVRTRRHGTLTYARSSGEAEDVTFFDRTRRRNIALYASAQKLSSRGRFYNEDDLRDYDVIDYQIEATISPEREFIEGRARMRLRVRAYALATLTIRLADPLAVTGLASTEHGRLLYLRVKGQNSIVVNLPTTMARDSEMTLVMAYSGRLPSQGVDREALQPSPQRAEDQPYVPAERHYLLSNRAYWHPQGPVTDFATATLRITVPEGYGCVASGELAEGSPVSLEESTLPQGGGKLYVFTAADPLRYLALVVSRFVRVADTTVPLVDGASAERAAPAVNADGSRVAGFRVRDSIALSVEANPRQQGRGREMTAWASDILRYYTDLVGESPYPAISLALVEDDLPGGHSPGYVAVLNNPRPSTPFVWRNDPAAFNGFPEFFLAHELAHQWWGQAVGWKNYHEQWISEGFAQYFAALYAQKAHGDATFADMLRQFRRWALAESDQGPVSLGYRLGHIRGEQKVFRALLYNKGAAVLHMLRRLVGDDMFFSALRRFYYEQKFQKAGTDDLQRAFEAETGRSLQRFFERWIYGAALPRLRYATAIREGDLTVRFEQMGSLVFDLPVTVTIVYADGRSTDVVVPVTEQEVVQKIALDGAVRSVHVNRDSAAIAHFDQS
ncbi:MAG: M1 family metallopeptidase [Vicinamibacterales bacterium]